jgi:hypothetical protein
MKTFIYHYQSIKPNGGQDESNIVLWGHHNTEQNMYEHAI